MQARRDLYDAENALIGTFAGINFWHTPKYVISYYLFIYCYLFSHRMQLYFPFAFFLRICLDSYIAQL